MKIYLVGIGPGGREEMTARAADALVRSDLIAGYEGYITLVREYFPDKTFLSTPMRGEEERCRKALEQAAAGKTVAMVCSGDAGVYGMAGLVCELAQSFPPVEIEIVPGVTAACSGAALLGAPLNHDFAVISLSDLLTPWEKIERRLHAASDGDFCISLYNPTSKKRVDYLRKACDILLQYRAADTPAGIVRNIGRKDQSARVLTLEALREEQADMFTTVFIGNSQTRQLGDRMVTPRGYPAEYTNAQQSVLSEKAAPPSPLYFPLFVPLSGRRAVVFGGGRIGTRRAKALAEYGVRVTVVAPVIDDALCALELIREYRSYRPGDCAGFALVIAATDNRAVNRAIAQEAREGKIPVNVADAPKECDFYFPALARTGDLVVGVTASGTDHTMVKRVTQRIRARLAGWKTDKEEEDA